MMKDDRDTKPLILKLEQDLPTLFSNSPRVLSAYLFGSTVQGGARSTSDVDIAVRVDEALPNDACFDLKMQLIDDLEKCLGHKVDVIIMAHASLKMIRQILVNGELVFARDLEEELDYRLRKQKEFFDFKYYLDRDIQDTREFFESSHGHRS
jgi:predicted nucleotidyltransferase